MTVKVNSAVRVISNLALATVIGLSVTCLVYLIVPMWFVAVLCGALCFIVYCVLWFGSTDDSRNA